MFIIFKNFNNRPQVKSNKIVEIRIQIGNSLVKIPETRLALFRSVLYLTTCLEEKKN